MTATVARAFWYSQAQAYGQTAALAMAASLSGEWLMGLPLEWTGFALAETAWFHWQRRMRSALSRLEH